MRFALYDDESGNILSSFAEEREARAALEEAVISHPEEKENLLILVLDEKGLAKKALRASDLLAS